mmetsp:Transcript_46933/g.135205  ORF Transcript_46933/g.135205 Transcript_46933/m.135205 type:complete len:595 (+) Transcript_46933:3-1787(+)
MAQHEQIDTNSVAAQAEAELSSLVGGGLPPPSQRRTHVRRAVAVAAVAAVGVLALVMLRPSSPCASRDSDAKPFEAVVEEYIAQQTDLALATKGAFGNGALWAQAAKETGLEAAMAASGKRLSRKEIARRAEIAVKKALTSGKPEDIDGLVGKAVKKAVYRSKESRAKTWARFKELQATGGRGSLRHKGPWWNRTRYSSTTKSPSEQQSDAGCVLDIFQITTILATFGSNVNDATQTCGTKEVEKSLVRSKVCRLNVAGSIANVAGLATNIAAAIAECEVSAVPNVDAICSASISSLLGSVAALAGAFSLISSSCTETGWYKGIDPDVKPSNLGSDRMKMPDEKDRRLGESAPPRQLLFGGGKGSLATQCATNIANTGWAIAAVVMAFNSAVNENQPNSCPPRNIVNGTNEPFGLLYKFSQGACAVDITTIISSLFVIAGFLQLITITCTDELNLESMCGAGITGTIAGAARIAAAAEVMWIGCDVGMTPEAKELEAELKAEEKKAQREDILAQYGRRLSGMVGMEDLKARYDSPADVWMELGYDFHDPHAVWRQFVQETEVRAADLELFVPDEEEEAESYTALFGQQERCIEG